VWEELGSRQSPSWYLDPLVARQKREVNLRYVRLRTAGLEPKRILKTDLFEEAFGEDHILADLFPSACFRCGAEVAYATARTAARRHPQLAAGLAVADIRQTAFRSASFDLVVSTSSLDHFDTRSEFLAAIGEMARVLRPAGVLILTLDNRSNPLYHPLRWLSRVGATPFPLGFTPGRHRLWRDLRQAGLEPFDEDWLLHNPRGLSTLLFLALRRVLRSRADWAVACLLRAFDLLDRLPSRRLTACFLALAARKL
jgi:SAM-dependent methyltransferase